MAGQVGAGIVGASRPPPRLSGASQTLLFSRPTLAVPAGANVPLENLAQFGGWGDVKSFDGFSVRVFRQAAISTDTVGGRVDALYGWATPYPEQACQFLGA